MSAKPRVFNVNDVLFNESDPSFSLFLIRKGTVAIRKKKGGQFVELARVYANEVIGEIAFFDRQPRSASAIAITEVEAVEITFEALDKIYATVPDYMKTIMASLAERLRKADETIRRLQKGIVEDEPPQVQGQDPSQSESKEEKK